MAPKKQLGTIKRPSARQARTIASKQGEYTAPGTHQKVGGTKRVFERADGRVLSRILIYCPVDVARKVGIYCLLNGMDQSTWIRGLIEEALRKAGKDIPKF